MKIVIPSFILSASNKLDQLKLTLALIHSYYYHGGDLPIVVLTNSDFIQNRVEDYSKTTETDITVDMVHTHQIKHDLKHIVDFYNKANKDKNIIHDSFVYLIPYYCVYNYSDSIILDNDMIFLQNVDFKSICDGSDSIIDFSCYRRENHPEWSVQDYLVDTLKNDYQTHGGCLYIPKNTKARYTDLLEEMTKNNDCLSDTSCALTDEYLQVYLSLGDNIIKHPTDSKINVYNRYDEADVKLVHFLLKPTILTLNRSKELVLKTKRPITEFNKETFKDIFITDKMTINILHWYKHISYVNESLNYYFMDLRHVDSNFFEEIITAIS